MTSSDRRTSDKDWFAHDPARLAARLRHQDEMAAADLFRPAEQRLREDDRLTISRLLKGLVSGLEHALRERLATGFADRPVLAEWLLSTRTVLALPLLERAGVLHDGALVRVLARRSEEARLVTRLEHRRRRARELDPLAGASPIEPLAAQFGPVGTAAAAFVAAEQRARDLAGEPLIGSAELPAEMHYRLAWQIAAALRIDLVRSHSIAPSEADRAISRAATACLAGYDERQNLFALAASLARQLAEQGRLDDDLIAGAMTASHVGFAVAGLGVRAGVGVDVAWDLARDPERLLLVCRAGRVGRATAGELVLQLGLDRNEQTLVESLKAYDTLPLEEAASAIGFWRLDASYRHAICLLAEEPAS